MAEPIKEKYTQKEDWQLHWSNFKPFVVEKSNIEDLCYDFPSKATFIEIGGFPGVFSIFFKKRFKYEVFLLDYFINQEILNEMERMNNLPKGSINQIETDFFEFTSEKKFDIVFSYGFIEHFTDTYNVIKQHVDLTDIKGKILILLPNLKGMSGLFLKWTDQKLFYKHNLDSMDLDLLKNICKSLKLNNVEVKYYGRPHIWINASSKFDNGFVRTMIKYFNGISQRIPLRNKFFAPLIAVKAYR